MAVVVIISELGFLFLFPWNVFLFISEVEKSYERSSREKKAFCVNSSYIVIAAT